VSDDDPTIPRDPTPRERFASSLRHVRGVRGMTQDRLTYLTDMHRTEISLLERSLREPRLGTLIKLSAVLEVPIDRFFEGQFT